VLLLAGTVRQSNRECGCPNPQHTLQAAASIHNVWDSWVLLLAGIGCQSNQECGCPNPQHTLQEAAGHTKCGSAGCCCWQGMSASPAKIIAASHAALSSCTLCEQQQACKIAVAQHGSEGNQPGRHIDVCTAHGVSGT
jgi:hypothetical protein